MSELVFQDEGHKYFLDGAEIPSVNQILHDMGFSGNRFYTDDSAARGKAIHFATRKLDEGWTPEQIGLEGIEPYIESYRLFKQGHPGFQWFRIEEPMANELMRYAGTPDRIGLDESGEPCVLDIKSGASATWHRIQLAGYDFEKNLRRYGLYLSAKGREPKLVPYEEPTDYLVWDYAVYLWGMAEEEPMKYPNVICPNCHRPTLRALWFNKYTMGRCVLTCLSCSWEKDITWRWMLKRRHIKMQQEQGRRERGEDAANPRDGRHQ